MNKLVIGNDKWYIVNCAMCGQNHRVGGVNIQEDEEGYFIVCSDNGTASIEMIEELKQWYKPYDQ